MSVAVDWDYPALRVFERIPWPRNANVAAVVYRFAERHAQGFASGVYTLRSAGYWMRVRLDREAGTLLVLYLKREG